LSPGAPANDKNKMISIINYHIRIINSWPIPRTEPQMLLGQLAYRTDKLYVTGSELITLSIA